MKLRIVIFFSSFCLIFGYFGACSNTEKRRADLPNKAPSKKQKNRTTEPQLSTQSQLPRFSSNWPSPSFDSRIFEPLRPDNISLINYSLFQPSKAPTLWQYPHDNDCRDNPISAFHSTNPLGRKECFSIPESIKTNLCRNESENAMNAFNNELPESNNPEHNQFVSLTPKLSRYNFTEVNSYLQNDIFSTFF